DAHPVAHVPGPMRALRGRCPCRQRSEPPELGRSGPAHPFRFQRRAPTPTAAADRASPPQRHKGACSGAIRPRIPEGDPAPEEVVEALSSPLPAPAEPFRTGIPRLSGRCYVLVTAHSAPIGPHPTPWYDSGHVRFRDPGGQSSPPPEVEKDPSH